MFQVGDTIGEYELIEKLGEGAYGVVFRVRNTVSEKFFALKVVPLAGRAGERELRALKRYLEFDHKNLIRIHHAGIFGDYLYYTMDLADGKLADAHLDPAQLRNAAEKLADALALLHQNGLLHRDIKPDNLFLRSGEVILGDIGLVAKGSEATFSGTPGFVSPRIWQEGFAPDEKSDLYALAKSFYCLLSGNRISEFPRYKGEMSQDASILFDAILSVCDDDGTISNAEDFRDRVKSDVRAPVMRRIFAFFRVRAIPYRTILRSLRTAAVIFVFFVALAITAFVFYYSAKVSAARAELAARQEAWRKAEAKNAAE